jgi:HEAT repeat protein
MLLNFMARLLGSTPAPAVEAPSTALERYNAAVKQMILDARRCDSVDRLIAYLDDRDGYVREAAIDRAAELGAPALLPALVPRLNDWVAPIRDKARAAVLAVLGALNPDKDAGAAMQLLQDIEQLKSARRTDHAAWIARFEQRLVEVMGAERILEAIDAGHGRIPQLSFALARAYALADAFTLCRRALANKGNFALARQAMDLARHLGEAEQQHIYRLALDAPVGIVRAEALRALLRAHATDPVPLATSMLADGNTWVRLVAISCLARQGIDVPGKYADMIAAAEADCGILRACLSGLADAGGPTHLDLVRKYATHPHARVQIAALFAWLHLAPKDKDDIARHVLGSPHRRVRKLFPKLVRLGAYVPVDVAISCMRTHGDVEHMLAFAQESPWTLLEVIATIAGEAEGDADIRHRLSHELNAWSRLTVLGYTRPTAQQRAFLRRETVQRTLLDLLDNAPDERRRVAHELQSL